MMMPCTRRYYLPLPAYVFFFSVILLIIPQVKADTLWLKNGDRISGTIVSMAADKLVFTSAYAGKLEIDWQQIDRFATTEKVRFVLSDENTINGQATVTDNAGEVIIAAGEVLKTAALKPTQIVAINPPKTDKRVKLTGRANIGSVFHSGNNDTSNVHLDTEMVARTESNRYTAGIVYNWAESDDIETESNLAASLQYDHFLNKRWFLATNASFLTDRFKDLNLRSIFGIGLGHQFWESEARNLSFELGVDYANEDYINAPDERYPTVHWHTNFDHFLFEKKLQFFHKHQLYSGLENKEDLLFHAETGLRFPLWNKLNATMQYNFDWDNTPAVNKTRTDEALMFNMGYSW